MEFGIFNDEGLLEGGFYSKEEADARMDQGYSEEEEGDVYTAPVCHDHPEFEKDNCDLCLIDAEEEEAAAEEE